MKNVITRLFAQDSWQRIIIFCVLATTVTVSHAQQLAFPGAEGYGRFTTGGRGGKVIEVTNLNNSGSGSLRAAVQSYGTRTIVFRVSGTIELKSRLVINNNNITIAGQTAPGDGICIKNAGFSIDANNVIIRYLRFRPGDENKIEEWDAINGTNERNIIIDHCSMSWSIDEVASFYDNSNFTMQWCLISESLYNSYHSKGAHGYGGIWGGMGATFHHNLFAHHSSRNPRFQGSRGTSTPETEIVDYRNNVIYNWGGNSVYAGEAGNHNMIANYYKAGPATRSGQLQYRIADPWHNDQYGSYADDKWYIAENYVYGYPEITADNWAGGVQGGDWQKITRLYEPVPHAPVLTYTAENAYQLALVDVGAVLPKRDSLDMRIIHEVRTGTATYGGIWGPGSGIIDSQTEVGGWPVLNSTPAPTDTDHDGMPDDWETANGLNLSDPDDRNGDLDSDGYTNLEEYLNSLCVRQDYILAPAGLSAATVSPSQIDLCWQENTENEISFSIERSENDTSSFVEIATVNVNDTSYSDTGLSPVTTYYYRVRAYNGQVYSIYTNYAKAKTLYADGSPLEAENPTPADNASDISIIATLRWIAGAGATSHNVYFGTTNPPEFRGTQTGTEYDPHGLMDSTIYYWRIDEVNNAGTTAGHLWSFVTEAFTPALTAHWPFNRGYGSFAQDATGNQNYGYLKNMQSSNWVEGFTGNALEFDGQDDYVLVNHKEFIDFHIRGFSISFWIRQNDKTLTVPYLSKRIYDAEIGGKGYEIYHDASGKVRFVVVDEYAESFVEASDSNFVTGNWVLLTAVRDQAAKMLHLYANGLLTASAADSSWNISQRADLFIGTNAAEQSFYKGTLDDIRVYNYALDSLGVQNLYNEYYTDVKEISTPMQYQLALNNYPNPFNPTTTIAYEVPSRNRVTLTVFNMLGQEIALLVDEVKPAARFMVLFNAADLNSGIYFYQLRVGKDVLTRKMVIMR